MREDTLRLRLRAILDAWLPVFAVVIVAFAALGGWATIGAHVNPGTVETTEEATVWGVEGSFDHSATVQRENPVFATNTTLTNRSTYFTRVSPVLEGTFTARYETAAGEPADGNLEARLVHRATGEETVYWTKSRPLAETDHTLEAGETGRLAFSFNASREADRRDNITEALGGSPGELETVIAVDVTTTSDAGGGSSLSYTATLPVTLSGDTYSVGSPAQTGEEVTKTRTETTTRERGPLMGIGGPIALLLGLGGIAGLGWLRQREEPIGLTDTERAVLTYRDQRQEYDEWVVRATLPEAVLDKETATADSFADLVDFAIDSDTAVVEEPERGQYYAVTPDLLVTYEPPESLQDD